MAYCAVHPKGGEQFCQDTLRVPANPPAAEKIISNKQKPTAVATGRKTLHIAQG